MSAATVPLKQGGGLHRAKPTCPRPKAAPLIPIGSAPPPPPPLAKAAKAPKASKAPKAPKAAIAKKAPKVKKLDRCQNRRPRPSRAQKKEWAREAKAREKKRRERAAAIAEGEDPSDEDYPDDVAQQSGEDSESESESESEGEGESESEAEFVVSETQGKKRKRSGGPAPRKPRANQVQKNLKGEAEALGTRGINDQMNLEFNPRTKEYDIPTDTRLFYPSWIDDSRVQNTTLAAACVRCGWNQQRALYTNIMHITKKDKQWYLRRWYSKPENEALRGESGSHLLTEEDLAEREERAGRQVEQRRTQSARSRGNGGALVAVAPVAYGPGPCPGVAQTAYDDLKLRLEAAEETLKSNETEIAHLKARLEAAQKEARNAAADAMQGRDELRRVREDGAKMLRRYKQAVVDVSGAQALQPIGERVGQLVEADAQATTLWQKAEAHAKELQNYATITSEVGQGLKQKIVDGLSVRPSKAAELALNVAETSVAFLNAALSNLPKVVTAITDAKERDAVLATKEKERAAHAAAQEKAAEAAAQAQKAAAVKAAADPARRAAEMAQLAEQEALERNAEAELAAMAVAVA